MIRKDFVESGHLGPECMEATLRNKDAGVAVAGIKSRCFGISKLHFNMALNNGNEEIIRVAKNHPNYRLYTSGQLKR